MSQAAYERQAIRTEASRLRAHAKSYRENRLSAGYLADMAEIAANMLEDLASENPGDRRMWSQVVNERQTAKN